MTKINSSKNLWGKLLLSLLLAFVLSATLFIGACGKTPSDNGDTDTEDTDTLPEDDQILKNGNFEIVSKNATYPITSPNSWGSRSFASTGAGGSNSPTSNYASGVIHAGKEIDDLNLTGEYADKQKEALKKLQITTRHGESAADNSHILMIANHRSDHKDNSDEGDISEKKLGTSQRFQSSTTLTIEQGTAVKISVWVRTVGDGENGSLLNYRGDSVSGADAAKAGAYIGFTNTVGGSEVAPFHIKNINTDGEWIEYTFLIEASDYTSTRIRLILGLGYGSDTFKEYAEGFAFFDDISYSVIPISDKFTDEDVKAYENADYDILNDTAQTIFKIEEGDKVVRSRGEAVLIESTSLIDLNEGKAELAPNFASKLSFAYGFSDSNEFNNLTAGDISIDLTKNTVKDKADKVAPYNAENDGISKIYTIDALKNLTQFTREEISLSKFLEKYPFEPSDKILFMGMVQPSSYTAKISAMSDAAFELGKDEYYSLSLWIKTGKKIGNSGVTLTITDKGKFGETKQEDYLKQTISGINTTTTEKETDYYDGWSKYTFYISNTSDIDHEFEFEITLGLTAIVDEANDNSHFNAYDSGYAAFTNLSYQKVSKAIYDVASASSANTKTVSLTAGVGSSNTTAFDSIIDSALEGAIESGAVAPKNYLGINGGTSANGTGEHAGSNLNEDVISGIIDRDFIDAEYLDNIGLASGFTLKASGITPYRPLLINNTKAASYGYVSTAKTLSANSLTLINVRLRVLGSAEAYVYLSSTKSGFPLLSLNVPETKDDDGEIIYANSENGIYQSYKNPSGVEDSGWIYMRFYIKAGDNSESYKIELFNGSRDAEALSAGAILFESINTRSVEQSEYNARLEVISEDNDDAVKFTQQILRNEDDEYEEMVVFVSGTWDGAYPVLFADFSPIDVVVPDETDDEDIDEPIDEDKTPARPSSDIWLMISSLILSLALIFTLVIVAAKKFRVRVAGKKSSAKTVYKGKVKHFTKSEKDGELLDDIKTKNKESVKPNENLDENDITDNEDETE